jgi:hypothetical protein
LTNKPDVAKVFSKKEEFLLYSWPPTGTSHWKSGYFGIIHTTISFVIGCNHIFQAEVVEVLT